MRPSQGHHSGGRGYAEQDSARPDHPRASARSGARIHGYLVYEVDLKKGAEEYEVVIDAGTGKVLCTERD